MNKLRRKRIEKAIALMEEAANILQECMEEEQEAYDNMPESLQCSERGEQMEEYIAILEDAIDNLDTGYLTEIVEG